MEIDDEIPPENEENDEDINEDDKKALEEKPKDQTATTEEKFESKTYRCLYCDGIYIGKDSINQHYESTHRNGGFPFFLGAYNPFFLTTYSKNHTKKADSF